MSPTFKTSQLLQYDPKFEAALSTSLGFEGGIDLHRVGNSGDSNSGITQQTYDSYVKQRKITPKDVKVLSDQEKKDFYYNEYYDRLNLKALPDKTAVMLFDYAINTPSGTAVKALQRTIGAKPDGSIGPKTIEALNAYIEKNGEQPLLQSIIDDRQKHNSNLIKENPQKYKKFENGWGNRIKSLKDTFQLSDLNPFAVTDAEASEEFKRARKTSDLMEGGTSKSVEGDTLGIKTSDLMVPGRNKLERVSETIANTLSGIDKKMKAVQGDLGKSLVIGTEQIGASLGTTLQWMGDNISEMDLGLQTSPAEDEELYKQMEDMGVDPKDIELIKKEVGTQRENGKRRDVFLNKVGDKISNLGEGIYKNITLKQQELAATRDPKVFQGTFQENPSFMRASALIAEALPTLALGTVVTFATGNPLAGAAAINFPMEGGDTYRKAKEAGKTTQEATAFGLTSGLGASILENVPLSRFLKGGEGKLLKDIGIGGLQEGGEEVLQSALSNIIAKLGYDDTRNLTEGMLEGLIAGAGSGGLIGGFTSGRVQGLDKGVQKAIAKGVNPQDIETLAGGLTQQVIENKDAIEKVLTDNVNLYSINNFTPEQMKDFANIAQWESNMPDGGRFSYGPADDLTFMSNPSGHSGAMQNIGVKKSFMLLKKISDNELLTEAEMNKAQALLDDYQKIKPHIDQLNKEIEDAGSNLTKAEKEEILKTLTDEDWVDALDTGKGQVINASIKGATLETKTGEFDDPVKKETRRIYEEAIRVLESMPTESGRKYWLKNLKDKSGKPLSDVLKGRIMVEAEKRIKAKSSGNKIDEQPIKESEAPYGKNQDVFFSKLEKVIEQKMPNAASADMVRGIVNSAGVKQEEIDYLDLESFLANKPKVTKKELIEYIQNNKVDVQEVEKRDDRPGKKLEALRVDYDLANERFQQIKDELGGRRIYLSGQPLRWLYNVSEGKNEDVPQKYVDELNSIADRRSDYLNARDNVDIDSPNGTETKFNQYQTPGGKNYKELLLTLPKKEGGVTGPKWWASVAGGTSDTANFRSSHFDEPNVLAHVRFNERTDAEGNKVLFIEEVQSDWHQQGRKKGYQKDEFVVTYLDDANNIQTKIFNNQEDAQKFLPSVRVSQSGIRHLRNGSVPDAPFKKTWHELVMKRMIRYAADNGFDKVAWTTGEQQAERYDLSKQVENITWSRLASDHNQVVIKIKPIGNGNPNITLVVSKDTGIIDTALVLKEVAGKPLSDVIGKDLSEKILKGDISGELKEDGLKIGGEGMKGFYDLILPSFVNKYVKKWGSKVEDINIKTDTKRQMIYKGPTYTLDQLKAARKITSGLSESKISPLTGKETSFAVTNVSTDNPLRDLIKKMEAGESFQDLMDKDGDFTSGVFLDLLGGKRVISKEVPVIEKVHSINITPAMQKSVMTEGQPLFEKSENYDIIQSKQLTFDDLQSEKEVSGGKQTISDSERNLKITTPQGVKAVYESPFAIKWKKDGYLNFPNQEVKTPADIAFAFQFLKDAGVENFYVGAIKDGQVVTVELITIGTINYASPSNFELFNVLQASDADGYFVVHNHPTGNVTPSVEDRRYTKTLIKAMTGKKFYGHIIINDGKFGFIGDNDGFTEYQHKDYAKTKKVPVLRKYTEWLKSKNLLDTPQIKSSGDIFELAKGIKTGNDESMMFNLDTGHRILSAYIIPDNFINAQNIIDLATRSRSNRIIMVSQKDIRQDKNALDNNFLKTDLSNAGITLLDVISSNGASYESAADKGILETNGEYKKDSKNAYREALKKKRDLLNQFQKEQNDVAKAKLSEQGQAVPEDQMDQSENKPIKTAELMKEKEPQKRKTADLMGESPKEQGSSKLDGKEATGEPSESVIASIIDKIKGKDSFPSKTPQEFQEFVSQLTKFSQSQAILRKGMRSKKAHGLFEGKVGQKPGVVKVNEESIMDDALYMATLAHELGHALEFNITGRTGSKIFKLFGDSLDYNTLQKLKSELISVSEDLEPGSTTGNRKKYYLKPAELTARFFEKMLVSPGNLNELAPTAVDLIEKQAILHPIIQEFLEAADKGIDKGAPKFILMRDLKETYQKHLGKRVGNIAFGEEMAYRAMKERGKIEIEKLIEKKFKGVKDEPELLFRTVESIKITTNDEPEFGTRDFVTAKNEEEEKKLIEAGWQLVDMPEWEDGEAKPVYAKVRYTQEQGQALYDQLTPAGKRLVKDFTSAREEAKDYFNREVIKDVNKIKGQIEGWVHHYHEDRPSSAMKPGQRFKTRLAGTRKHRTGSEGYVEDFKKAMHKVLIDLESEKVYNDFIGRQFARVTEPIAQGAQPKPGWVEVVGSLKSGVGLPQEKSMMVIDSATGKKIPIRQTRYQMPKPIYERYKLWRGLIDEATTMVRIVNDINRYWRINILAHIGTASTNFIGGGLQYSSKILTDFYTEVLTGNIKMPQTQANLSAMIKVLMPKGWNAAPDWVYGSDLSNFYGQDIKTKSLAGKTIDAYANGSLKLFGTVERYWKKVILTADGVADIQSLGEMTPEGLRLPTKEEREILAELNAATDLYGLDYDNVPAWLEAHSRSAVGQAIKPFAKYPYKYAKLVLDHIQSAFDGTLPWQTRLAKILTLTTYMAAYAAFSYRRKEEQQTLEAEEGIEIPARLQPRGRLFIGTDEEGREKFVRVSKYPFINLSEAGMQIVDGHFEGAKDLFSEMLGSIGPTAQIGMLALNYRNKYQTYDSVPVIIGDSLVTFMPGYRMLNDISRMLDPYQRKQETFAQTFTKIIPTTSEALQEKLHGKIRTERVPTEGEIQREGRRTTVDHQLESYKEDVLLSMLSGIYVSRVDPKIAEAYIIRKTKNLEQKARKEERLNARFGEVTDE